MTPEELTAWRKANKLPSRWYIAVDGQIRDDTVTLGEAQNLRYEFSSLPIHLMHVSQSPNGEWIHLDHPEDSALSFAASWRKHPASDKQKEVLRYFNIRIARHLTKGEASLYIDRLFLDPENREKWEAEKDRREDEADEEEDNRPRPKRSRAKPKQKSGCGCLLFLIAGILLLLMFGGL